jgi:G:T-mismatch repair DNA endonuclease (very short patch repair protein)
MKIKCEKCDCEFDNKMFKLHVKNAHLDEFSNENEMELFVLKNRFNLSNELITELIGKYKNDGSVFSLVNEYGIPHKSLSLLLKLNNVKLKSLSEVSKQKSVREKYISTCLNKYGVSNVSKYNEVKEKKKETFIENYGVDNIFKNLEFKESLNDLMINKYGIKRLTNPLKISDAWLNKTEVEKKLIVEKVKLTKSNWSDNRKSEIINKMLETKSNWSDDERFINNSNISNALKKIWSNLSDDEFNKRMIRLHKNFISKLEIRVRDALNRMNISFTPQFPLNNLIYDIKIDNTNILIEVNGDFWHGNPRKYKSTDILPFPKKEVIVESLWKKDEKKLNIALKNGYKLLPLWEMDIKPLNDIELELFLLGEINKI